MKNRIISAVLSIILVFSLIPEIVLPAEADSIASGRCGENISWMLDSTGTMTISGEGAMDDYGQFSEDWRGNHAYSLLDQPWSKERSRIKTLVVDNGITYIGETAFSNCENLTTVSLPNSLVYIGNAAFAGCSSLKEISLPNKITTIGILAFSSCKNLTTIHIPSGLKQIEDSAFLNCDALKIVNYSGSEKDWGEITVGESNWQLVNANIVFGEYVLVNTSVVASGECGDNVTWILTSDGALTISGYGAMTGWSNFKSVPWYSYVNQILSVNIKSGVTTVGSCSFVGCAYLEKATLPDTIIKIYDGAFSSCKKLTTIEIPEGVTTIGSDAFTGCTSLTTIILPMSVTMISAEAFNGCDSISDVYYAGSELSWNSIKIYKGNDPLTHAALHTNYSSTGINTLSSDNNHKDLNKRLTQIVITYSDGSKGNTVFNYNESGLLVSTKMITPYSTQETVYSYDGEQRLISAQVQSDDWYAIWPSVEYIYDSNGFLIESSEAEGSQTIKYYENDPMGRCIRSTSEGEGMSYSSEYTYSSNPAKIEEVLTKTDYEGKTTTDYISYFFDDAGNITGEVCSGAAYSYNRQYTYDNKPFVAVSEYNNTPFRIYLPDIMGHPIWEIEDLAIATMQNDADGYLNRVITDYGDIYDFEYEMISTQTGTPEKGGVSSDENIADGYSLEVYSIDRNLSVKPGRELQLICSLYSDGKLIEEWDGVSWGFVSDPTYGEIIEVSKYEKIDLGYRLYIKGLKEGNVTFSISESSTGATISLDIKVGNKYAVPIGCSVENVPSITLNQIGDFGTQVNFYNCNGLYISDFYNEYNQKKDNYLVKFNVYNSSYMHGSVDIYDKEGVWIGSQKISKHESVKGVVDTLYGGTIALAEWCSGRSFSYKASTYSTKTSVEIEIPSGGYFVVSNNMAHSPGVYIYNGIDYFLQILSAANDLAFKAIDVDEIQELTIEKLLESDTFLMSYQQSIVDMTINASGDALENGYVNTMSGIIDGMVDFIGDAIEESVSTTLGIAEDVVVGMIPSQFSVWLDVIFGISTVTDSLGQAIDMCRSVDKTYINIYTPLASGQLTVEGVHAKPEKDALPENAMLQVCRLPSSEPLSAKQVGVETEDYQLYDICFTSDGVEVQPDGHVTIKLPVPQSYNWTDYAVLHQQEDGSWETVDSTLDGDSLVVTVDHFSLFAIIDGSSVQKKNDSRNYLTVIIPVGIIIVGIILATYSRNIRKRKRKSKGGRFLKAKK